MARHAPVPSSAPTPLDHLGLFENSPNPYLVLDRSLNIAGANKAYLASVKRDLGDIVGRWAWEAFPTDPETERQAVASFERVIRTRQPDTMALLRFDVPRPASEGGGLEKRYWSITHTPILDERGAVSLVLQHPIDVTELETLREGVRASESEAGLRLNPSHSGIFDRARSVFEQNLALQEDREHLQRMFAKAPSFMAILNGPGHVFQLTNEAYQRVIGHRDVLGRTVADALPEAAAQGYVELLDRVYASGEAYTAESAPLSVQASPDGPSDRRFLDFVYQPMLDGEGRVTGIFVEGHDVTERVIGEKRILESEAWNRQILDSAIDYAIIATDRDGLVTRWNAGAHHVLGWTEEEMLGQSAECFFTPEDVANGRIDIEMRNALETGRGNDERWHMRKSGERFFAVGEMTVLRDQAGAAVGFVKVLRDWTNQHQAEEQGRELTREMAHRMKNVLAMVQSIATQTFRTAESLTDARDAVSGRITALARAQDILTQTQWEAAPIEKVVANALAPHRTTGTDRFTLSGPPVQLMSQQALGLSLALHELATNAAKYGALSDAFGNVEVVWSLGGDGGFQFVWQEVGGPPVHKPTRTGFGSRLIERLVAAYFDGSTTLTFDPLGVRFKLIGQVTTAAEQSSRSATN